MRARGPMGCAGLDLRGRAAHWLIAGIWLLLAFGASTPAQALPRSAFDPSLAVQRDLAHSNLPRQLEADLPDLVDTARPAEFDTDGAVPRRIAVAAFIVASPPAGLRPFAVLPALPRAFHPRAPPSLR